MKIKDMAQIYLRLVPATLAEDEIGILIFFAFPDFSLSEAKMLWERFQPIILMLSHHDGIHMHRLVWKKNSA